MQHIEDYKAQVMYRFAVPAITEIKVRLAFEKLSTKTCRYH